MTGPKAAMTTPLYAGTFEAHVTLSGLANTVASCELERFVALCKELSVKPVLIELPQGQVPSQPMTASYHRGDLVSVQEEVTQLAAKLRGAGFVPSRIKVEAMVKNQDIPKTDGEALALPEANYFEYHGKLRLQAGSPWDPVRTLCANQGAHLSSNARKQLSQCGEEERFVTVRYYGMGQVQADERFHLLCQTLAQAGHLLFHKLREYVVYDSCATLDQGWMEP